jgi:hypothetical protein
MDSRGSSLSRFALTVTNLETSYLLVESLLPFGSPT